MLTTEQNGVKSRIDSTWTLQILRHSVAESHLSVVRCSFFDMLFCGMSIHGQWYFHRTLLKLIFGGHLPFLCGLPNLTFYRLKCLMIFLSAFSKHLCQLHVIIFCLIYVPNNDHLSCLIFSILRRYHQLFPKATILPNEVIFRDPVYLLTKSMAHIPIH